MGHSFHSHRFDQLRASRKVGSIVHCEAQLLAWLAKLDRKTRRVKSSYTSYQDPRYDIIEWVNEWSLPSAYCITACSWSREHPSRVLRLDPAGLVTRFVVSTIREWVNCPGCLVLTDAILELQ